MNRKRLLIILLVLALLGLAVYFIIRFKSKTNGKEPNGPITEPVPFPLKFGSRGPEVGQLQKYLLKEFGAQVSSSGAIDEWWGSMTEAAVNKFMQRDNVSRSTYFKFKMDKY